VGANINGSEKYVKQYSQLSPKNYLNNFYRIKNKQFYLVSKKSYSKILIAFGWTFMAQLKQTSVRLKHGNFFPAPTGPRGS